MRNLTKVYFDQGTQYYSESSDKLINIKNMAPQHAANAARRLLIDVETWAAECGIAPQRAAHWMMNTVLWRSLMARATVGWPIVAAPKLAKPQTIIDDDGDRWMRGGDGLYACTRRDGAPVTIGARSYEEIRDAFGIREE